MQSWAAASPECRSSDTVQVFRVSAGHGLRVEQSNGGLKPLGSVQQSKIIVYRYTTPHCRLRCILSRALRLLLKRVARREVLRAGLTDAHLSSSRALLNKRAQMRAESSLFKSNGRGGEGRWERGGEEGEEVKREGTAAVFL